MTKGAGSGGWLISAGVKSNPQNVEPMTYAVFQSPYTACLCLF